jgi:hypothetical protein
MMTDAGSDQKVWRLVVVSSVQRENKKKVPEDGEKMDEVSAEGVFWDKLYKSWSEN